MFDLENIKTSNNYLRKAMFKAFNGRCFYTGEKLTENEMIIDHVIPKSKGGKDSVYNYVITSQRINTKKNNKYNPELAERIVFIIKTAYSDKVVKLLAKYHKQNKPGNISGGDRKKILRRRLYKQYASHDKVIRV